MRKPSFKEERKLWKDGVEYVLGIDEVGRGAFAGPIVAAGVVFPKILRITRKLSFLKQINDSKQLKAPIRRKLSKKIQKHSVFYAVEEVDIKTINKLGIGRANQMAIKRVAKNISLQVKNQDFFILCDGLPVRGLKNHLSIIDGDCKSITIAAASIIAKVYRDNLMRRLAKIHPQYKLSRNKGYGTKKHQEALKLYGLSEIHRKSFNLNKFLSQSI